MLHIGGITTCPYTPIIVKLIAILPSQTVSCVNHWLKSSLLLTSVARYLEANFLPFRKQNASPLKDSVG
jgi:hypothetical protein